MAEDDGVRASFAADLPPPLENVSVLRVVCAGPRSSSAASTITGSAERLMNALDERDAEWRAMIILAVKTGLRLGELLALRWDDIDLVTGRLVVRQAVARGIIGTPKSGKSREVPLAGSALAALKRIRHLRGELVFSDADGELWSKGEAKWPLWRATKKAGLRRIGWHVLRHTFASATRRSR